MDSFEHLVTTIGLPADSGIKHVIRGANEVEAQEIFDKFIADITTVTTYRCEALKLRILAAHPPNLPFAASWKLQNLVGECLKDIFLRA